ncbi:transporter [Flavobacterium sp. 3HN19-14]|uniref:transporter n=1 Tax=Flavobacterium sp. 3HN19-14 TaxID=3448133 RepID=UPI003EDE9D0A
MIPDLASSKLKAEYYAPRFRFTMQHTLSDKISLGYNLGAEWDGETPDATFLYTLTTGFSLSEKLGCYIEVYGFAPQNDTADHRLDGGFTYLVSDNFMIDVSADLELPRMRRIIIRRLGFHFVFKKNNVNCNIKKSNTIKMT